MSDIEFNGIPEYIRPRKLEETNFDLPRDYLSDQKPPVKEDRELIIENELYKVAETFIKGEALKRAISKMEPAQFIPVDEKAETVIAACQRLFKKESEDASIVTFSMYQSCIEKINSKKRNSKAKFRIQSPVISKESFTSTSSDIKSNGSGDSIIKQFLDHNGIAGTIISMLILSPFQGILFQSLSPVETTTRTAQSIQIPVGLVLLLELGIKAERISKLFKTSKIDIPLIDDQLVRLENPEYRAQVLNDFGIDYSSMKKDLEIYDCEAIIGYVSDYYSRYGGLVSPGSHLTIDHWIAYLHVSQSQEILRNGLAIAPNYSDDFNDLLGKEEITPATDLIPKTEKTKMSIHLASVFRSMREQTNDVYDDIVNSLVYQLSDDALCCLVSIFGSMGNTDILNTIASILRILAVDLGGELTRIDNIARGLLANYFNSMIFELCSNIEKITEKLLLKISKIFTASIAGTEKCVGLLSIGYAFMESLNLLSNKIKDLLKEISSAVNAFGLQRPGAWIIAADRKHLLGMARILEVMSAKISIANGCSQKIKSNTPSVIAPEPVDQVDYEIVHKILGESPPTLQMSRKEIDRYFPNLTPTISKKLKYSVGIKRLQNLETPDGESHCDQPISDADIQAMIESVNSIIRESFE